MAATYINTPFVITNNQTDYTLNQIWVSFSGVFMNTGVDQTIGTQVVTDFTSTWRSFALNDLALYISGGSYLNNTPQFGFSFNGFSGRIYINYGSTALSGSPDPSSPGNMPYIVFEMAVQGLTLPAPIPSASNMDLSYVDGVSAPAQTMICNAQTGAALQATSVNPVTTLPDIMANIAPALPPNAKVTNNGQLVRVMSSAAAPSAYHDWNHLISTLQEITAKTPLKVNSYTSPATGIPPSYALSGVLFGYSGAPAINGQMPNFNLAQSYTTTATFVANLNPQSNAVLLSQKITNETPGVIIAGTGSVCGAFSIYITQSNLNAGSGIYGNNPPYVVMYGTTSYSTAGIVNDLGGRVVGDLMAGMVFGWAASSVNIADYAATTGTNLYGVTFSANTIGKISTGELFFLLSLAGSQGKLTLWIGARLDSDSKNYDQYLYAIAKNSSAYGSGFSDRLQGCSNPDTYWYTANPPAIPGGNGNYETVGFVNLVLGQMETAGIKLVLTNNSTQSLTLISQTMIGHDNSSTLNLPQTITTGQPGRGAIMPSKTPAYRMTWTYSPDNGQTLLTFDCFLSGSQGIYISPSSTGPQAKVWTLAESPSLVDGSWLVQYTYTPA